MESSSGSHVSIPFKRERGAKDNGKIDVWNGNNVFVSIPFKRERADELLEFLEVGTDAPSQH